MPLGRHGASVTELAEVVLATCAIAGSFSQNGGGPWQVIEQPVHKTVASVLHKRRIGIVANDGISLGTFGRVAPTQRRGRISTLTGMLGRDGTMGLEGGAFQLHGRKGKGHCELLL